MDINTQPVKVGHYLIYEPYTEVELVISGKHLLYCAEPSTEEGKLKYEFKEINIPEKTRGVITSTVMPSNEIFKFLGFKNVTGMSFVPVLLDVSALGLSIWLTENQFKVVSGEGKDIFLKKCYTVPVSIVFKRPNAFIRALRFIFGGIHYVKLNITK